MPTIRLAASARTAGNKKGSCTGQLPEGVIMHGDCSDHQGRENVLTFVKLFMASMTPSL